MNFRTSLIAPVVAAAMMVGPLWAAPTFTSDFECGNGTGFTETAPGRYSFQMEADTNSDDRQWYSFEVSDAEGELLTFDLQGISSTNVTGHWTTAWPVFSIDGGDTWERIPLQPSRTTTVYTFSHLVTADPTRFAFHDPYPYTHALEKFDEWAAHSEVSRTVLGQSVEGRDIVHFKVADSADAAGKAGIWIIARQHAAEVTGSFVMEGFFDYLLSDEEDARALRAGAVLNIIPFMNPDGATAGNYRDNAEGVNLNRVWNGSATLRDSPEVVLAEGAINEWANAGNDYRMFIDLHSTSGANPHFAFHAASSIVSAEYYAETREFLTLIDGFAPHFNHNQGASTSTSRALAYHDQREGRGIQAFTFEAGYNYQENGPTRNAFMTPEKHREVGVAIARALVALYELEPPVAEEGWNLF